MHRYSLALFFSFIIYCTGQDFQKGLQPPSGYWNNTFIKLYLALGLIDLVDRSPEIPPNIEVFADIIFKDTEQRPLKLDIYRKKNIHQSAPVIIFIHGGSWKTGDKKDIWSTCYILQKKTLSLFPFLIDFYRRLYFQLRLKMSAAA